MHVHVAEHFEGACLLTAYIGPDALVEAEQAPLGHDLVEGLAQALDAALARDDAGDHHLTRRPTATP